MKLPKVQWKTVGKVTSSTDIVEHLGILLGFLLGLHGIGTRGAGHAVEADDAGRGGEWELDVFPNLGNGYVEVAAEGLGGELSCSDYGFALGK